MLVFGWPIVTICESRALFCFIIKINLIRLFLFDDAAAIVRKPPGELYIFCVLTTTESRAKIWYQQNAFTP